MNEIVDIEKCIEQTQAKVSDDNPSLTVPKVIIDRWIKSQLHKEFIDTLYNLTHGLSFMHSDKHIIEAINNNTNLEKIYVGCFNQPSKDIKEAFKDNGKVVFFNTYGMF